MRPQAFAKVFYYVFVKRSSFRDCAIIPGRGGWKIGGGGIGENDNKREEVWMQNLIHTGGCITFSFLFAN